jgi:hypothetical protein
MHIDEFRRRKKEGKPIESGWELVHALNEVRERLKPNTRLWFLMNRFTREVMDDAAHGSPERVKR